MTKCDKTLDMMQVKLFQFAKCIFSLLVLAGVALSDPPDNPCPELFQYKFDGSDWVGLIELNNIKVNQTVVNISAELSLAISLPSPYKGRLDLLEGQQQAVQAVLEGRPLFYRISFPVRNPIPKVTQIVVDNDVLCSGPPDGLSCNLTDGTAGVCTIINKCSAIFKGLIRYEELAKNRCDIVDGTDFVCCKDPDPPTGRRADDACATYKPGYEYDHISFPNLPVAYGEFPYLAALGHSTFTHLGDYDWKCLAALISDQYLLTSAHCITRYEPVVAKLGKVSFDIDNDDSDLGHFEIDELIKHPNYMNNKLYHDIALVRLKLKLNFTDKIRPACLNTNQTPLPPETDVKLIKLGTRYFSFTTMASSALIKKNLKTVEFSSCNEFYANIRTLPKGLTEGEMCALDPDLVENTRKCEENSEGLLQKLDNNMKLVIYGVTNFLGGCALSLPGVYTSFSNYIDWIEPIVWPHVST